MKKLITFLALALLAANVNATVWVIDSSAQGGVTGNDQQTGLGMNFWFTQGVNGNSTQNMYSNGAGPGYACFGLDNVAGGGGPTSCTAAGTPEIWTAGNVVYTGSLNDDFSFLNLSWTGTVGVEPLNLFVNGATSGSYNAAGDASGTFFCFNGPIGVGALGADFCGNGTAMPPTTSALGPQTIANKDLANGFFKFIDNGDGTIEIRLRSLVYNECIADFACIPGSGSSNVFAKWTLNATLGVIPVPAAVWLFGSALGLLGWIRRRATH